MLISRKFRRSLLDVKARRRADIGNDHELVTIREKFKLARIAKPFRKRTFSVVRLGEQDVRGVFRISCATDFKI